MNCMSVVVRFVRAMKKRKRVGQRKREAEAK